jgi:MoxR-like ATPase
MVKFKLSEVKEAIKRLYDLKIPVLLNGGSGVGKTSIVREIAKELELPLLDIRLSTEAPENVGGIPRPDPSNPEEFFKKILNKDLAPAFKGGAVLFFDELNRSNLWIRNAVMSAFFERTLGGKELDPRTLVIGAINSGLDYKDTEELDRALLARFAIINVATDMEELINYMSGNYPIFASILASKSQAIENRLSAENGYEPIKPTLTPRNLEFAAKVIETYHNDPFMRKLLYAVVDPDIADLLLADIDFSKIRMILNGEKVELERDKFPVVMAIISNMTLKDEEFVNAVKFAKEIYTKYNLEDSLVSFLSTLARRNKNLFIKYITVINKEIPNLKDLITL